MFSEALLDRLASARSVAVLTGAGVSAESGIPTFRDRAGHWTKYDPMKLASPQGFRADPILVQRWYAERIRTVSDAEPNSAHRALATLQHAFEDFVVITQNVDGLHRRAGSANVLELHGNILDAYCVNCGDATGPGLLNADFPVRCGSCGGYIRPAVTWFGEHLPIGAFHEAQAAAGRADIFLSVGTSSVVYPAASLLPVAAQAGAYTVEVNTEPSALADVVDEIVVGRAGDILPQLVGHLDATRVRSLPD